MPEGMLGKLKKRIVGTPFGKGGVPKKGEVPKDDAKKGKDGTFGKKHGSGFKKWAEGKKKRTELGSR